MKIHSLSQLDLTASYSYADYLLWQFDERVELIKGLILKMSPAPSMRHQTILGNIHPILHTFYRNKQCKVFFAPFDVRLYNRKKSERKNKDIFTVVQPDLCVVCNPEILDEKGCNGAPDWIIEILSPGNTKRDVVDKFALYAEAGVKEYWIISPADETVTQFFLNDEGKYQHIGLYANEGTIVPQLFSELVIDLSDVFAD